VIYNRISGPNGMPLGTSSSSPEVSYVCPYLQTNFNSKIFSSSSSSFSSFLRLFFIPMCVCCDLDSTSGNGRFLANHSAEHLQFVTVSTPRETSRPNVDYFNSAGDIYTRCRIFQLRGKHLDQMSNISTPRETSRQDVTISTARETSRQDDDYFNCAGDI
jgi:hypothetical protein